MSGSLSVCGQCGSIGGPGPLAGDARHGWCALRDKPVMLTFWLCSFVRCHPTVNGTWYLASTRHTEGRGDIKRDGRSAVRNENEMIKAGKFGECKEGREIKGEKSNEDKNNHEYQQQ